MKLLFEVAHPKHYYVFKNLIKLLHPSHVIKVIARPKDIVCELLDAEGVEYDIFGRHGKSMKSKFVLLPKIFFNYLKVIKDFKPDLIVSKGSPYAAITGKITHVKTCILPDSEVVFSNNYMVAPLSSCVISSKTYGRDFGSKHKRVSGFFEEGYLHPRFLDAEVENLSVVELPCVNKKFALLRFVGWYANHDVGKFGFSDDQKIKLVDLIKRHCEVLISSEGALPPELEKYRFKAPVNKMHHTLYKAALYIGDSQTMATEAALCGTPTIRYNSFVGENDMTNFKILENKGMLLNLSSYDSVCDKTKEILKDPSSKEEAQRKRELYFQQVVDINKEIIQHIEVLLSN